MAREVFVQPRRQPGLKLARGVHTGTGRATPGGIQSSTAARRLLRCAAASRSITARQPELTCERLRIMQAVILETFGISLEQSRMASPVHICWASEENARPGDA